VSAPASPATHRADKSSPHIDITVTDDAVWTVCEVNLSALLLCLACSALPLLCSSSCYSREPPNTSSSLRVPQRTEERAPDARLLRHIPPFAVRTPLDILRFNELRQPARVHPQQAAHTHAHARAVVGESVLLPSALWVGFRVRERSEGQGVGELG
jgi:hypothetical protein